MKKLVITLMSIIGLTLSLSAISAEKFPVSDKVVSSLGQFSRAHLSGARLSGGRNVPPETAAEKAKPIIPESKARQVVESGIFAAIQSTCHIDWNSGYHAFMDAERAKKIWSDKQMAYMGLLHGLTMGMFESGFKDKGGCTPSLKRYTL